MALAFALLLACGGGEPPPATTTASEEPRAETLGQPPAGEALFRIAGDRLTLVANAAPRGPLLDALADQLDFDVVSGDVGEEPVTLRIEDAHLRDALPQLLPDRAYRVAYRFDAATGRHEVARLEIAPSGASAFVAMPDFVIPDFVPDLGETRAITPRATQAKLLSPPDPDRQSEAEADWEALLLRLDDADVDERIEALELIDPEGNGLPLIIDRLARDPDPRVRAAAAEKLDFSDTLVSVDALVSALNDPDKQVVLAAIDALELTDDITVTEDLALLLQHADEEIREAADEAIDFISDAEEE
ncbi:MAG: HEAT repeat domain-containing protein [Myxococcota bacterium]|nr:HEAT repeat domain-containing protein [Myxococcota bacterium]